MIDLTKRISEMKTEEELMSDLAIIPPYHESIRQKSKNDRLIELSTIYQIYIPSPMTVEIYSKLYLALLRSLQKKSQREAIKQRNENYRAIHQQSYQGILGGSDSFTIIGVSGIGKSSAINRSISLISKNNIIETDVPMMKIIPCLIVQCPFDSSVKGLLLEILRSVDEKLGTNYYHSAIKSRTATTDMLIGSVSTIALNHIGLLIVDEIQNVVNSKNGKNLVGSLTQLINNSGISIGMVGTPECTLFFEQAMQLARRSIGLYYTALEYNDYFEVFCKTLFQYQYVMQKSEITPAIINWLYEHSAGVLSTVVTLIHDAQEIAILTGREVLNLETLNEAYRQRLVLLERYIRFPKSSQKAPKNSPKNELMNFPKSSQKTSQKTNLGPQIQELAKLAKTSNISMIQLLKKYEYTVIEVKI